MQINKDDEITTLNELAQRQEVSLKEQIDSKDEVISEIASNCEILKTELEQLQQLKAKEKEDMELIISEKDSEKQVRVTVSMTCQNVVDQCGVGFTVFKCAFF